MIDILSNKETFRDSEMETYSDQDVALYGTATAAGGTGRIMFQKVFDLYKRGNPKTNQKAMV